jgi:phage-related protein
MSDYASALSDAAGKSLFGDDQIAQSTNLLLTFTNIKGTVLDAATAISVDMAQALGGAPADAAVQLGKALQDPIAGISALTRLGVTFSEEQKAVIQSMMDTGNVAGAQQVIIAELNKEFGGSAAAAAAAAGPMAQLSGIFGELAEGIAAKLLPVLDQFVNWLSTPVVLEAITNIGTGLVDAVLAAVGAFVSFMETISPVVGFVADNLTPILAALAAMLITVVVPAFIAWATTASAAAIATIAALAPVIAPIVAIGAAVGLLTAAWVNNWGDIQGKTQVVVNWWTGTAQPAIIGVFNAVVAQVGIMRAAWDRDFATVRGIMQATAAVISSVWNSIQSAIQVGTNAVLGILRGAWSTIKGIIEAPFLAARATISGVMNTILGYIQGAISAINGLISLINRIPGVNVPGLPGGGSSGFGGNSFGGMVPLGGVSNSQTININAPGASMSPAQFEAVVRRVITTSGFAADVRNRVR